MHNKLIIKGARQHNLKNIDLELEKDSLIVISGLSGSGKSSLAFDTIFAKDRDGTSSHSAPMRGSFLVASRNHRL